MQVLDPGHAYNLEKVEDEEYGIGIRFIKKEEQDGELVTVKDGTTNEEVLRMMLHRMEYLQDKMPCPENEQAIGGLTMALSALERRTRARKEQEVEGTNQPHS